MEAILELGKSLLGPEPGITLLLFLGLGLALWAYWKEKLKNEAIAADRLKEAREDTELFMEALHEATNTIGEFKASNDALKTAFEILSRSVVHAPGKSHDGG